MLLSICTQTFHADLRCHSVDNGDSTEAESACGDTDVDKSEKEADSVAEVKVEVSETAVEVVDEKVKDTIPSSEQGNIHTIPSSEQRNIRILLHLVNKVTYASGKQGNIRIW